MSDRPMHTIPGAMQRLQQIYANGTAAIEEGRLDEAVALFTSGLAIDDHFRHQYITMYAQRAFTLHRLGRIEEAVADYSKAIEMEPEMNQAQYHFQRGMCFAALEQPERAVADFGSSIALYPDHPGPYHLRGKLLVERLDRSADAIADLDKLLTMNEVPEGYQLRALANVNLHHYAAALPDAQRAEELAPTPYNHYLLAVSHAALGHEPAAEEHVRAALAGAPSFADYFREVPELAAFRARPWFKQLLG